MKIANFITQGIRRHFCYLLVFFPCYFFFFILWYGNSNMESVDYLILLVLLKSPILIVLYFKWNTIKKIKIHNITKSKIKDLFKNQSNFLKSGTEIN